MERSPNPPFRIMSVGLFFFSSRRRHTRSLRDWSSDVCSSDLIDRPMILEKAKREGLVDAHMDALSDDQLLRVIARPGFSTRSEERRVGKECRSRWLAYQ